MKGDFTRDTIDPAKHFRRVQMQQGTIEVDSDWDERLRVVSRVFISAGVGMLLVGLLIK
jgi:uncharacterized protein DUF6519